MIGREIGGIVLLPKVCWARKSWIANAILELMN